MVEQYLNKILDNILNKRALSKMQRDFLFSFKNDNQEEFFNIFKDKIEKEGILDNVKIGDYYDIVKISKFSDSKVTKEVYKVSDNKFELNSTTDGWLTAYLDKEELIKYMVGEIDDLDLDWF